MKNKKIVGAVIAVVLVGAGFGGGYAFAKSQNPARDGFAAGANFQGGQFAARGAVGASSMRGGGNFIAGEILSKDASGVTIKMQDGSTKIILIGSSAQINKNAVGNMDDLAAGTNVTITGTTNSDGSVTAQAVQIRPAGFNTSSSTPRQ